jgi:CIC family chloride channel protein
MKLALTQRQKVEARKLFDTLILGVAGAGAALLFGWLLRISQQLFLVKLAGYTMPDLDITGVVHPAILGPHGLWLIPVSTTLGGLIAGFLVFTFAPEAEGHGTDTVVAAFHRTAGVIRARVAPLKMVASAITIGSGGSAGREGPTALITAGFGSIYGSWTKRTDEERRFLIIVGMAAGLSAVFRSPIGTAVFAIEVLYGGMEFESSLLIYTMLASVVAYAVNGAVVGLHPMFDIPASLREPGDRTYGWYALLGIACGVLGVVLPVVFYKMRDLFRRLPVPQWLKPAIGGLLVGLMALEWPQLLGGGYAWMQLAINGDMILKLVVALALLKIVSLSLTVSSGGSGGVFAPALFIGCMLGSATGLMLHLPAAPFAVVGMAALFGAAARVPFATLLMVVEMTGGYQLLVPAGLAVMIAYLVQVLASTPFRHRSLYEAQVESRAQSAAHYVADLRNAMDVIEKGHVKGQKELGTLDLFALLQTGIALAIGGGKELTTAIVAPQSKLAGMTVQAITEKFEAGNWDVMAIFREGQGVITPSPELVLEDNDRMLLLASPEVRHMLMDYGVLRSSGLASSGTAGPAVATS